MASPKRQAAYKLGHDAEKLATAYLQRHGYAILAQRYKTAYGEIDIIARKDSTLAFIEVKARSTHTDALESISPRQRKRICEAANYYLSELVNCNDDIRFDVVTIAPDHSLHHLPNAWEVDVMGMGF